jgi:hypothetical protein
MVFAVWLIARGFERDATPLTRIERSLVDAMT